MPNQFLAIYEETTRGTAPGSPVYQFLPIISGLTPEINFDDKPREEFRGVDNALGDATVIRREQSWSYKLKCYWYPGKETGLLFKHLMGFAATRSVVETSGYKGILYPVAMPYGAGNTLVDKAIAIIPNTDEQGTTKCQVFGGGRVTECKITASGSDDIILEFSLAGAWIGTIDQTAISGVSFPAANPYNSTEYKAYIGGTPTRTGTAPNYTALAVGTAVQFYPDSLDLTITNGLKDKIAHGSGVMGPTKTYRDASFNWSLDVPLDYEDPSSGFSSADEYKKLFTGPSTNNLMLVFDNGDLAGATTEKYTSIIDLPLGKLKNPGSVERNPNGKMPNLKLGFDRLLSSTTQYPIALLNVDKATAY